MSKIGFIGCGNMGGALARAVGKSGHEVFLSDFDRQKTETVAAEIGENAKVSDNREITAECDLIFLGVKPQVLRALADEIKSELAARNSRFCLISMAAGISLSKLAELFGNYPTIRIMPNTPAAIGCGMILVCMGKTAGEGDRKLLGAALSFAGELDNIDEKQIDAASAISGCGPAFVCQFAEALADGGVRCGLPRDKALRYALATLKGTASLIAASGKHPGQVKDEVCSPGGSTIEGVLALEAGGFRSLASDAVIAAYEKTLELGNK